MVGPHGCKHWISKYTLTCIDLHEGAPITRCPGSPHACYLILVIAYYTSNYHNALFNQAKCSLSIWEI